MGNILFFSGVALTIGLKSSLQFFMKRSNYKGTAAFGAGFFFVIIGWPILGMILEAYGFIVLFSGFWPTLSVFLQKIPILGWIFQQPFVRSVPYVLPEVGTLDGGGSGGGGENTYVRALRYGSAHGCSLTATMENVSLYKP
uniref:Golgi transport 1 protein B n=1 Tax=Solanum tuberosum TaxID=4113 RepID=M1C8C7_SOLTU